MENIRENVIATEENIGAVIANWVNSKKFSASKKAQILTDVIMHPERAVEIAKAFNVLTETERQEAAYIEGVSYDKALEKKASERKAKLDAQAKAKAHDDELYSAACRNAVLNGVNPIIKGKNNPAYKEAVQAEYEKLKKAKNVMFNTYETSFVYDMDMSNLSARQIQQIQEKQFAERMSHSEVKTDKELRIKDGEHKFSIISVTNFAPKEDRSISQWVTLEDKRTGERVSFCWIVDKNAKDEEKYFTRRYIESGIRMSNPNITIQDEDEIVELLKKIEFRAWTFDDGKKKNPRVFFTENSFNRYYEKFIKTKELEEERAKEARERKAMNEELSETVSYSEIFGNRNSIDKQARPVEDEANF